MTWNLASETVMIKNWTTGWIFVFCLTHINQELLAQLSLALHLYSHWVKVETFKRKLTTWRILFSVSYTVQSCKKKKKRRRRKWRNERKGGIDVNIRTKAQISSSSTYQMTEAGIWEEWLLFHWSKITISIFIFQPPTFSLLFYIISFQWSWNSSGFRNY